MEGVNVSKRRDDMVYDAKKTSSEEMMVIEGLMLTHASENKHRVFKKTKFNRICKN